MKKDANEKLKLLEKNHDISEDNLKIELENIQEIKCSNGNKFLAADFLQVVISYFIEYFLG